MFGSRSEEVGTLSVSAGWKHVGAARYKVSIITSDGGYRFRASSLHLLTRVARMFGSRSEEVGALSVRAGWMHVGAARHNLSIITSDGGYRFRASSRHLLTRVARMFSSRSEEVGALSVSAGWKHVSVARHNLSIITSDGGYRFERPVATCSHAWLGCLVRAAKKSEPSA
jgi:hypothetical protein